jgi:hypothetical protein
VLLNRFSSYELKGNKKLKYVLKIELVLIATELIRFQRLFLTSNTKMYKNDQILI